MQTAPQTPAQLLLDLQSFEKELEAYLNPSLYAQAKKKLYKIHPYEWGFALFILGTTTLFGYSLSYAISSSNKLSKRKDEIETYCTEIKFDNLCENYDEKDENENTWLKIVESCCANVTTPITCQDDFENLTDKYCSASSNNSGAILITIIAGLLLAAILAAVLMPKKTNRQYAEILDDTIRTNYVEYPLVKKSNDLIDILRTLQIPGMIANSSIAKKRDELISKLPTAFDSQSLTMGKIKEIEQALSSLVDDLNTTNRPLVSSPGLGNVQNLILNQDPERGMSSVLRYLRCCK
jgi:hypothetical protein